MSGRDQVKTTQRWWAPLRLWLDTSAAPEGGDSGVDWVRCVPFLLMHAACLGVIWTGYSVASVATALGLYLFRMFAVTGFYHRYFSHRTFKTSRAGQFLFALAGATAVQRGPLWWAAHHRDHHRHSDREEDPHSPHQHGFWWSHVGWITSRSNFPTKMSLVPDLARFPELRFLDRFDTLIPLLLAISLYGFGEWLSLAFPESGAGGGQMLVWGFFISTVVLFHATCLINSLAHRMGRRRYRTGDESRNSFLLALVTLGEGWHNNHHHFPAAARQGFFWWEVDFTFYALKALSWTGLIWDLRPVPDPARGRRLVAERSLP